MVTLAKSDGPADLREPDGKGITRLDVGISWDKTGGGSRLGILKKGIGTDLDLLGICMNGSDPVRMAGLDSLDPLQNGSVVHTGDNKTGKGDGDDEQILCQFDKIPANVTSIVFVAAAYKKGSSLKNAANISFKVYDSSDGKQDQVADIWPSMMATGNACAIAKITRGVGLEWKLEVINEMGSVTQGDQTSLLRFAINK